jgi:hypothetical protein
MLSNQFILVSCPICKHEKDIPFPDNLSDLNKNGLLTIKIPAGTVCPHGFLIFIDVHNEIRGYGTKIIETEQPRVVDYHYLFKNDRSEANSF